ncbi:MAG: hypothetical protein KQH79_17430 [Bacteroidetes bacterium]|nr:hypothetical protein [Bacteroidota bacterium]
MNSSFFVQEYLSSLKEDKELDYLFPLLLKSMGFRIIRTPNEAKGQSQYGKDVIAIGKDENNINHKWYFELKGYTDKDINENNFHKKDGILESLREAKFVNFEDYSIPELQELPTKIVLVHNGILKPNFLATFNGFIKQELAGFNFERWDIYKLSDLFSTYLFGEYFLIDVESNSLLKKTFAFWDIEDYDFKEFKELVQLQFEMTEELKGRAFSKLFATLGLLNTLVLHYSTENDNLVPAKECSKFLILHTWSWILKNNLASKKAVIKEFKKLLTGQFEIFNNYFKKTFSIARIPDGLFAENGSLFEKIGYPLRCFEYIDDLIYYCRLRNCVFESKDPVKLKNIQKDYIIDLIENNNGCFRPIFDNHSIPIIQLFLFFSDEKGRRQKDINFIANYVFRVISNLKVQKIRMNILPELNNNLELVIEASANEIKPKSYCDSTSVLIAILLELCVVFDSEQFFKEILSFIDEKLSLQIASIDFESYDVEQLLFERSLGDLYHVESIERVQDGSKLLKVEANFEEFKNLVKEKIEELPNFITDNIGLDSIRYLAHSYFKNEILPFEWRKYINHS